MKNDQLYKLTKSYIGHLKQCDVVLSNLKVILRQISNGKFFIFKIISMEIKDNVYKYMAIGEPSINQCYAILVIAGLAHVKENNNYREKDHLCPTFKGLWVNSKTKFL